MSTTIGSEVPQGPPVSALEEISPQGYKTFLEKPEHKKYATFSNCLTSIFVASMASLVSRVDFDYFFNESKFLNSPVTFSIDAMCFFTALSLIPVSFCSKKAISHFIYDKYKSEVDAKNGVFNYDSPGVLHNSDLRKIS